MAEALVAVSGVASIAQLVVYLVKTIKAVTEFYNTVHNAPAQVRRIEEQLGMLNTVVDDIRTYQKLFDDDIILPPNLRQKLFESIKRINDTMHRIQSNLKLYELTSKKNLRGRMKWAAKEKRRIEPEEHELEHCGEILDSIIQLITLRSSLLGSFYAQKSANLIQKLSKNTERFPPGSKSTVVTSLIPISRDRMKNFQKSGLMTWKQAVINSDSYLRKLGLYGSFTLATRTGEECQAQIQFGFELPTWLYTGSVDIQVEISRLTAQEFGIKLSRGEIKVQNRVPDDSPFMMACRNGDIELIRQHLQERTGNIRSRTMCTGSTPLLLVIEGKHFEALKCLLEFGADPNIGDDSQTLPLFALLGMNGPRVNKWIRQIPPTWNLWLDAFKLLVEHGASVHEINSDKSLVNLNITHGGPGIDRNYPEPSALQFFQILRDQCFTNFSLTGPDLWNPVLTAIRRQNQSIETLRYLSDAGVNLSRIATNGHTSLHWAAEMASDPKCLEYLCSTSAVENINRQDKWGWTPLHYAISSGRYGYRSIALDKATCLLRHGADFGLKAKTHPLFFVRANLTEFDPLQLSLQIDSDLSSLLRKKIDEMKMNFPEDSADEMFFDAMEIQP
ncbi:MAG: hypothetical protein M1814_002517 [Vezdaea aestivalis]|nr:MAG: hypothetical protein M1814_002517 [Vezdaea aestivalis]